MRLNAFLFPRGHTEVSALFPPRNAAAPTAIPTPQRPHALSTEGAIA